MTDLHLYLRELLLFLILLFKLAKPPIALISKIAVDSYAFLMFH